MPSRIVFGGILDYYYGRAIYQGEDYFMDVKRIASEKHIEWKGKIEVIARAPGGA